MSRIIQEAIELGVPASVAYGQWTRFDEFPKFMVGIREVRLVDDAHMHWSATVAGMSEEWDAEITEQVPGRRLAWRATAGATNTGVVMFSDIGRDRSRLMLRLQYEPNGIAELVGDSLGLVRWRVISDLKRFKHYIEDQEASGPPAGTIPLSEALVGQ